MIPAKCIKLHERSLSTIIWPNRYKRVLTIHWHNNPACGVSEPAIFIFKWKSAFCFRLSWSFYILHIVFSSHSSTRIKERQQTLRRKKRVCSRRNYFGVTIFGRSGIRAPCYEFTWGFICIIRSHASFTRCFILPFPFYEPALSHSQVCQLKMQDMPGIYTPQIPSARRRPSRCHEENTVATVAACRG